MTEEELIEQLAHYEHESWARWMDYLFNRCDLEKRNDGFRYVIPRELVERWKRQVDTPYAELSEQEKQSDRDEVAHILPIIYEYASRRVIKSVAALDQIHRSQCNNSEDQAFLARTVSVLEQKVDRLCAEVFYSTIISKSSKEGEIARERRTLLGRVNDLSEKSGLASESGPWIDPGEEG